MQEHNYLRTLEYHTVSLNISALTESVKSNILLHAAHPVCRHGHNHKPLPRGAPVTTNQFLFLGYALTA